MTIEYKDIQAAVDRLLLEQGVYTPVELLLAEGRLMYADYEAWRGGGIDCLEDCLFGDPEQGRRLLEQAAAYVQALELEPETLNYRVWGQGAEQGLCFSQNRQAERCFNTRYCKPADVPQLDLFMDATGTTLVNGIVQALVERNPAEARRLLDRLFDADPGQAQLGRLERLVEGAEALDTPVEACDATLHDLRYERVPMAEELLGAGSRHYLAPQWRRLTQALQGAAFDPLQPERHASFTALQAEDWVIVRDSVEAVSGWRHQAVLLCRHARACGRLHQPAESLCGWFQLCWQFPEQAACIGTQAEPEWQRHWRRFLDLDTELPNRDFPAWLLLDQPGLLKRFNLTERLLEPDSPDDVRASIDLIQATTAGGATGLIDKRQALQACNPGLFAHYMGNA